jgi:hypothetical protein
VVGRYGICVTNDHGDVPLVVNTSQSFPHSWLITTGSTSGVHPRLLVGFVWLDL